MAEIYPGIVTHAATVGQANFDLNKLDRLLEWGSKTTIIFKGSNEIPLKIGTTYFSTVADVTISTATDLDVGAISNGKDYYVYACNSSGQLVFKISLASTFPFGFTAVTSRKIGGFHTLCVNVGVIAGHPLSGFLANEILPQSVWDLKHRCRNSKNEGMVYSSGINKWVQIYLAADDGASGVMSVYGATILDTLDWMEFVDRGGKVGMRLLNDDEFQVIAAGSNEQTNISGSLDPVTTGGHSDTAARRMISDIGCEDCAGAMWQWLRDQSDRVDGLSHQHTENTAPAYTQNALTAAADPAPAFAWFALPGGKGQMYRQNPYGDVKLLAGGNWNNGARCGSRSRYADSFTLAGVRMRISAVGSLRSHCERRTDGVMRRQNITVTQKCYRLMGLIAGSSRAVIGIMGRIAGLGLVMRITIAGIRIRISAVSSLQTQEY